MELLPLKAKFRPKVLMDLLAAKQRDTRLQN